MSDKEPFQFGPWTWGDDGKQKPEYKEPTGRHLCCGMDAEMRPFADGDWVPYAEYKKIEDSLRLAINERALQKVGLDMYVQRVESGQVNREKNETIARLKAENERLIIEVQKLTIALRTADRIIKPLRDKSAKEGDKCE